MGGGSGDKVADPGLQDLGSPGVTGVTMGHNVPYTNEEVRGKGVAVNVGWYLIIPRHDRSDIHHIFPGRRVVLYDLETPDHFGAKFFKDLAIGHEPVGPRGGEEAHRAVGDSVFVEIPRDHGHYDVQGRTTSAILHKEDDVLLPAGELFEGRRAKGRSKGGDEFFFEVFQWGDVGHLTFEDHGLLGGLETDYFVSVGNIISHQVTPSPHRISTLKMCGLYTASDKTCDRLTLVEASSKKNENRFPVSDNNTWDYYVNENRR